MYFRLCSVNLLPYVRKENEVRVNFIFLKGLKDTVDHIATIHALLLSQEFPVSGAV
jgi:hypothetical protein